MKDLTISSKGQITLPKWARASLGLTAGSKLTVRLEPHAKLTLTKRPALEDYYGKLDGFWGSSDPAKEIRAWRERDHKRTRP